MYRLYERYQSRHELKIYTKKKKTTKKLKTNKYENKYENDNAYMMLMTVGLIYRK